MEARFAYWKNVFIEVYFYMTQFEQQFIGVVSLLVILAYLVGRTFIKGARSRAWILSFISSSTLASIGLYTAFIFFQRWRFGQDPYYILSDDVISRSTTFFFVIILFLDLVIGSIDYPGEVNILTGWIHHIFYIGMLSWVLFEHYSICLCVFFPLEVPTVIMSIGSLNKQWRNDFLFGTTFLLTRLLYHGALMWQFYHMERLSFLTPLTFSVWLVHWYWFYGFYKQQQRKSKVQIKEQNSNSKIEAPKSPKKSNIKSPTRVKDD